MPELAPRLEFREDTMAMWRALVQSQRGGTNFRKCAEQMGRVNRAGETSPICELLPSAGVADERNLDVPPEWAGSSGIQSGKDAAWEQATRLESLHVEAGERHPMPHKPGMWKSQGCVPSLRACWLSPKSSAVWMFQKPGGPSRMKFTDSVSFTSRKLKGLRSNVR